MKNPDVIKVCQEFCTGCGLCASVRGTHFFEGSNKFQSPELTEKDCDFCAEVCPAAGNAANNYLSGTIWGNVVSCYLGWSVDEDVRFRASSGGVLTAVCIYLIQNKIVDGIIQVKRAADDQTKTITVVNTTAEGVLECLGSRYTSSAPLMNIKEMIESGKKYAFVGKPCDISALRMYQISEKEEWVSQIEYMFSFFCAGQSSEKANRKLLKALGCDSPTELQDLSYRGNGWPGYATVTLKNGVTNKMEYEQSWMTILGRDVRKSCRFCVDGTGEMADISCGDAWCLGSDGKPDFAEASGRNVIFSRTEKGEALMNQLIAHKAIKAESYDLQKSELKKIQPYHYNRKSSMSSVVLAMKLCGREYPLYGKKILKKFAKDYPLKNKILRCAGTIKRVWSKTI